MGAKDSKPDQEPLGLPVALFQALLPFLDVRSIAMVSGVAQSWAKQTKLLMGKHSHGFILCGRYVVCGTFAPDGLSSEHVLLNKISVHTTMTSGGKAMPRIQFRELRLEEFRDDVKACLRQHPRFAGCSTFIVGLQNKELADAVPEILNSFYNGKHKFEVNYVTVPAGDPLPAVRGMLSFAREKLRTKAPKYPRANGGFAWTPVGGLESKEDEWLDELVQNQNFTFDCDLVDPEAELLSARNNLGLPPRADATVFHHVELWGEPYSAESKEISREEWSHLSVPLKISGAAATVDLKSILGASARVRVGYNPETNAKVSVHLSSFLHYLSSRHYRLDRVPLYIADDEVLLKNPKALASLVHCPANFPPEWLPRPEDPAVIPPWLLVGPEGSGTNFHVEPNNQCVFVHCLSGFKTWLVFPPETFSGNERLLNQHPSLIAPTDLPGAGSHPSKIYQEAGDIIVLPPNWWHTVINRAETVAVAVNFLPPQ